MELVINNYILGNCIESSLREIQENHIIPVFTKDNTALISQSQFIESTGNTLSKLEYSNVSKPLIRLSHEIKGRIPSAIHKKRDELLPNEITSYYERMIFLYRIESIKRMVNGEELSLVVGGVKAYNLDNFNRDHRAVQSFKVFIGFQVQVCSNLCIWSDGSVLDIRVNNIETLEFEIAKLISNYNAELILDKIEKLKNYSISEHQFAQLLGKCRMYQYLPKVQKDKLPIIDITDSQVNNVAKQYYYDDNFACSSNGIDLWSLYNLFTHSSKTSYIDRYVDRIADSSLLTTELVNHLEGHKKSYFLS